MPAPLFAAESGTAKGKGATGKDLEYQLPEFSLPSLPHSTHDNQCFGCKLLIPNMILSAAIHKQPPGLQE